MKKILALAFISLCTCTTSFATIVIVIATGLKPGVTYSGGVRSNITCGENNITAVGSCWRENWSYETTCPTWAAVHNQCPNASVIDLDFDEEINDFVNDIFDDFINVGVHNGTQQRLFYNVATLETYRVTINWLRLSNSDYRLTITDEII